MQIYFGRAGAKCIPVKNERTTLRRQAFRCTRAQRTGEAIFCLFLTKGFPLQSFTQNRTNVKPVIILKFNPYRE